MRCICFGEWVKCKQRRKKVKVCRNQKADVQIHFLHFMVSTFLVLYASLIWILLLVNVIHYGQLLWYQGEKERQGENGCKKTMMKNNLSKKKKTKNFAFRDTFLWRCSEIMQNQLFTFNGKLLLKSMFNAIPQQKGTSEEIPFNNRAM